MFDYTNYQVLLACGSTDMRKSINGLCEIVQLHFSMDPSEKIIFVFCNGAKNRIKLLVWEGNGVCLRLNIPTTTQEIELFYQIIEKICHKFHTDYFVRGGEKTRLSYIESCIANDTDATICALADITNDIQSEEAKYKHFTIFGACIPLSIGLTEVIKINRDLDTFANWLNEKQQLDAYYANPHIYKNNSGLFGVYAIGAEIVSIMPTEPYVIMNQIENVPNWYVIIGKNHEMVLFSDFITNVKEKLYFDSNHVIIKLCENEIQELLSQYKVEI